MYDAPKLEDCKLYLNKTQKYIQDGSYTAITDLSHEYYNIKYPIRELGKKLRSSNDGKIPVCTEELYSSKDEMINEAINFFYSLSSNYGAAIAKVVKNPEVYDKIHLQKVGYDTGYTTLTSDNKIQLRLDITPTAQGMVALCQELANAHVLSQSIDNERVEESKEDHFVDKTVNMFVSGCITEYLCQNANLPDHEQQILRFESMKELMFDCNKLQADSELFKEVIEKHPEIFQSSIENFNEENFAKALEDLSRVRDESLMNAINARIKDIAYDGKTTFSVRGDVAKRLAVLKMAGKLDTSKNIVADKIVEGIINGQMLIEATGMEEEDIIRQGSNLVNDLDLLQENQKVPLPKYPNNNAE